MSGYCLDNGGGVWRAMCDQILTKYDKHDQTHVDFYPERPFLEINKSNAKNHTGMGWVGGHLDIGGDGLGYRRV